MGEAKRRRLLDPNFGKTKTPDCFETIKSQFLSKEIDLEIMPFSDFDNFYPGKATNHHLILPSPFHQNDARQVFTEHQQQVMNSLIPLIQEHGKGWIAQKHDYQTDSTQWGYVPATSFTLTHLETEVFSGSLGKMFTSVMRFALESWCFDESNQLIPVVAMTNFYKDSSWLYCI